MVRYCICSATISAGRIPVRIRINLTCQMLVPLGYL